MMFVSADWPLTVLCQFIDWLNQQSPCEVLIAHKTAFCFELNEQRNDFLVPTQ